MHENMFLKKCGYENSRFCVAGGTFMKLGLKLLNVLKTTAT